MAVKLTMKLAGKLLPPVREHVTVALVLKGTTEAVKTITMCKLSTIARYRRAGG